MYAISTELSLLSSFKFELLQYLSRLISVCSLALSFASRFLFFYPSSRDSSGTHLGVSPPAPKGLLSLTRAALYRSADWSLRSMRA